MDAARVIGDRAPRTRPDRRLAVAMDLPLNGEVFASGPRITAVAESESHDVLGVHECRWM